MTAKRRRVDALEARQARPRVLTLPGPDALHELGRRVFLALPEDLRSQVGGAHALARLRAAYVRGFYAGEDLRAGALRGYRAAFLGEA